MIKLLQILKKTIKKNYVGLHDPYFEKKDYLIFKKILSDKFVGSAGKELLKFKRLLKYKFNFKNISLTNSGHASLYIILKALGTNDKHEILIPNLNYIAAANTIIMNNSDPHLVDISDYDLGINVEKLSKYLNKITFQKKGLTFNKYTGKQIFACIALHPFGFACNIFELKKLLNKYNILLIEDAAEALGSLYKNKNLGNIGYASALSFNANKIITCGGGGAIVSSNKQFIKKCDHLVSVAKVKHNYKFYHDAASFNFRMPNLNAALGITQLNKFKKILKIKRKIHKNYFLSFKENKNYNLMTDKKSEKSNNWLNILVLKNNLNKRDKIIKYLISKNITVRPAWELMDTIPFLKKIPKMNLNISKKIYKKIICLPSGINIT